MSVAISTVGPLTVWGDGEEGGEEKVVAEFGESEGEKEGGEREMTLLTALAVLCVSEMPIQHFPAN